jgi:hypothetical protein
MKTVKAASSCTKPNYPSSSLIIYACCPTGSLLLQSSEYHSISLCPCIADLKPLSALCNHIHWAIGKLAELANLPKKTRPWITT